MYTLLGDLAGMQNARLKSICREMGIRGFSKMTREQMQQAVLNKQRRRDGKV
jgi:hypothetical protein